MVSILYMAIRRSTARCASIPKAPTASTLRAKATARKPVDASIIKKNRQDKINQSAYTQIDRMQHIFGFADNKLLL